MENNSDQNDYAAILLCAGKSSRMGAAKGSLVFENTPWLIHQIKNLQNCGLQNITVVINREQTDYIKWIHENNIECSIVINENAESGQFSSIKIGIKKTLSEIKSLFLAGVFVQPLDCPVPDKNIFTDMIKAHHKLNPVVLSRYKEKSGHPLLISKIYAEELLTKSIDSRLDYLLRDLHEKEVIKIDSDDVKIILNLNTVESWNNFKKTYEKL